MLKEVGLAQRDRFPLSFGVQSQSADVACTALLPGAWRNEDLVRQKYCIHPGCIQVQCNQLANGGVSYIITWHCTQTWTAL